MTFKVNRKERLYFGIMAALGLLFYFSLFMLGFVLGVSTKFPLLVYIAFFILLSILGKAFLIGRVKGNAIKISEDQFPDVFEILKSHSLSLGLSKIPAMYVLQGNGVLNAFAVRFVRKNFVILFSNVFEVAYEEGKDAVSFIIGHELGHIKRNHVGFLKTILLLPARLIPFLSFAYSRGCEYTCDNIGYNLSQRGAVNGLLILAAGKKLYTRVNVASLMNKINEHKGFPCWFAEILSSHPPLVKRIAVLKDLDIFDTETKDFDFTFHGRDFKSPEVRQ